MSMRKQIQNAFDNVHAPEELVERMKQELYQKDFHEEVEEMTCEVSEAPRQSIWRYVAYIAASLVLCIGCGFSVWNLRDSEEPLNPGTTVPVVTSTTEETTESTTSDAAAAKAEEEAARQTLLAYGAELQARMIAEEAISQQTEAEIMQHIYEAEEDLYQRLLVCQEESERRMILEETIRKQTQTQTS